MKKLFALSIIILFASASFCQKIDESKVPDPVIQTLKAKFATAKDIVWEQEDTVYSAEFLMDEAKTEVEFDKKGAWLNTEWEIPIEYTPNGIKKFIDSAYTGSKIKEIAVMDFPNDGKLYVTEICKKKNCHKVYFSLKYEFKKAETIVCDKKKKCCKKKKCDKTTAKSTM